MASGGWLHEGKVLAPLMFVVLYENLSVLFAFCVLTYLFFRRKKSSDWKKRKRHIIYIFYWFERTGSFAYVPVRDQNLVVRGKNWRSIGFVFFISFKKGFKMKSQVANEYLFVFFKLKEKPKIELDWFNVWLKK